MAIFPDIITELKNTLNSFLSDIIGLTHLKKQLLDFTIRAAMVKIRKSKGITTPLKRPVFLFLGNPGTGKTAIAAIVAGKQ